MQDIQELWPELEWIQDPDLRDRVTATWVLALEKSVLSTDDLKRIPFTLLAGPDLKVSFMDHKRAVVHIAKESGLKFNEFFTEELPVNMDVLIAGAILADVGKLLEYEKDTDGKCIQGKYGSYLRHPFSGVSLAEQCGVPAEVCHIIAAHAAEGDLVKRSTEAYIVHHADFMTFLPFKNKDLPAGAAAQAGPRTKNQEQRTRNKEPRAKTKTRDKRRGISKRNKSESYY